MITAQGLDELSMRWVVVLDRSGHYRAVSVSQRLRDGESVKSKFLGYIEACHEADRFNTVAEVLQS